MPPASVPAHEDIGPRIKRLREARGLSQSDLARKLDTDSQTVSRWETGKTKLPAKHLRARLADALGVTPEALLGREPVQEARQVSQAGERRTDRLEPLREAIRTVQEVSDQAVDELVRQVVLYVDRRWPRLG